MATHAHTSRRAVLSAAPAIAFAPALPAHTNRFAAAGAWIKEYRAAGGSFAILNGAIYFGSVYPPAPEIGPLQGQLDGSILHQVRALVGEGLRRGVL